MLLLSTLRSRFLIALVLLGANMTPFATQGSEIRSATALNLSSQRNTTSTIFPIRWKLGKLDSRFNVPREDVRNAIEEAINLWETAAKRRLFVYDDRKGFPINLVYDDRQRREERVVSSKKRIKESDEALSVAQEKLDVQRESYDRELASYQKAVKSYNERLDTYNRRVRYWNDNGSAPKDVIQSLESERLSLKSDSEQLNSSKSSLDRQHTDFNRQIDAFNAQLDRHRTLVNAFNAEFGKRVRVTLGECVRSGNEVQSISVFAFRDVSQLTFTLAHELGHAIGLKHVRGQESVMVAVENGEKASEAMELSPNDLKELFRVLNQK